MSKMQRGVSSWFALTELQLRAVWVFFREDEVGGRLRVRAT